MNLIIVDKDKFREDISAWNSSSIRTSAEISLTRATLSGIGAIYQLVEQEKAKNDALLQKQIELEQKSSEYQNLLNGLNADN